MSFWIDLLPPQTLTQVNSPEKKRFRRLHTKTRLARFAAIYLMIAQLGFAGCQVSSRQSLEWLPNTSQQQASKSTKGTSGSNQALEAAPIPSLENADYETSYFAPQPRTLEVGQPAFEPDAFVRAANFETPAIVSSAEPTLTASTLTQIGDSTNLTHPETEAQITLESDAPQPVLEEQFGEYLTVESATPSTGSTDSTDSTSGETADLASVVETSDAPIPSITVEVPWSSGFPENLDGMNNLPRDAWPLSLDEAIQLAFENTTVLRSLGVQILTNPEGTPSAFDPWIVSSDPRSGADAALANFDANLNADINYANNDDVFNSSVLAGGANQVQQDLVNSSLAWQKFGSTGTQYSVTGQIDYDANTRPSNLFPSVYTTLVEAEVRQPLLQGRGREFNSIAGPTSRVDRQGGTGILIAQANIDVSVVQFERNVTSFVDDIISAYWTLHLAYQNVLIARESFKQAEKTWLAAQARNTTGLEGGEAYREALAREQRDRTEVELLEAIHNTGQSGAPGLLQADAQLRLLLNLPSDGQTLIYPIDDPIASATVFDTESLKQSAIAKRVEVREQNIRVERDQMQLLAANNFLLPRLDAVAVYRNNGFGDTFDSGSAAGLQSAVDVAANGLYDEWEIGLQYNMTLGARRAKAGIRNSRLRLRRSRQLLKEIETRIHFDVETALRSASRSELTFAAARRLKDAARESYESHQAAFQSDLTTIDELLRSQQRFADAQRTYNRQLIDRTLAIEGIFRETGSLLEMHGVKSECQSCDSPLLSNVSTIR